MGLGYLLMLILVLFFVALATSDEFKYNAPDPLPAAICIFSWFVCSGLFIWFIIACFTPSPGYDITISKTYPIKNVSKPDGSVIQIIVDENGHMFNMNDMLGQTFAEGQIIRFERRENKPCCGIDFGAVNELYTLGKPAEKNDKASSN